MPTSPAAMMSRAGSGGRQPDSALLGHGLAFAALTLAWLVLVARAGATLRVPAVRRALDLVTGVVLVSFGVRLATERR